MNPAPPGPVGRALARFVEPHGTWKMRKLSNAVGMSEKAVQSIIEGRSQDPKGGTTLKLARVLEVPVLALLEGTAVPGMSSPEAGEFVADPEERLLLSAFRELPEEERTEAYRFIEFRLALRGWRRSTP